MEIILRTSIAFHIVKVYGQMVGGIYRTYCYGLPKQLSLLTNVLIFIYWMPWQISTQTNVLVLSSTITRKLHYILLNNIIVLFGTELVKWSFGITNQVQFPQYFAVVFTMHIYNNNSRSVLISGISLQDFKFNMLRYSACQNVKE